MARTSTLAGRIGLSVSSAQRLIGVAIDDACRVQGIARDLDQGPHEAVACIIGVDMHATPESSRTAAAARWLRLVPPPTRFAPLLRTLPPTLQRRMLESAMQRVLAASLAAGALDFMRGRRLGIDVTDLDLHWVVEGCDGRLRAVAGAAEASVRGSATDLLLLASRLEDADTLFFQRRLVLTGDTELGLTVRNLLERLPWESVPLGLRILLNRGARAARAARAAHRGEA